MKTSTNSFKSWLPIIIIFSALFVFCILINSCQCKEPTYYKGVVLSSIVYESRITYRIKDLETNQIVNTSFSMFDHYYEVGDTITLYR
jgi:hypothetical protein